MENVASSSYITGKCNGFAGCFNYASVCNEQVNGKTGRFLLSDHIRSLLFYEAYVQY